MKRIMISMSDQCAALLKMYAAQWGMTQSAVCYEAIRQHIHSQAQSGCLSTLNLLKMHNIKLDKRAFKPCYGYACRICKHQGACRAGLHPGNWECGTCYKHLLSPTVEPE